MDETTGPTLPEAFSPEQFYEPVEVIFGDVVTPIAENDRQLERSVVVGTGKTWLFLSQIGIKNGQESLMPAGTELMRVKQTGERWDKDKVISGLEWMWKMNGHNDDLRQAIIKDMEAAADQPSVLYYAPRNP